MVVVDGQKTIAGVRICIRLFTFVLWTLASITQQCRRFAILDADTGVLTQVHLVFTTCLHHKPHIEVYCNFLSKHTMPFARPLNLCHL